MQGREGGRRWTLFSASDDRGHLPINFVVLFSSIYSNLLSLQQNKYAISCAANCLVRFPFFIYFIYTDRKTKSRNNRKTGMTGKPEWLENQNDWKARMTGKAGTTGMIPASIYWSNDATCTNRWGGPKYNLLIVLSWFFCTACTALTCTSWEIKPNIITGN